MQLSLDALMENTINCAEACLNGWVLGEKCPNKGYAEATSQFINDTFLAQILEMTETAVMKKRITPPKWVIPEFPE